MNTEHPTSNNERRTGPARTPCADTPARRNAGSIPTLTEAEKAVVLDGPSDNGVKGAALLERTILRSMFQDHLQMSESMLNIGNHALAASELRAAIETLDQLKALDTKGHESGTKGHKVLPHGHDIVEV